MRNKNPKFPTFCLEILKMDLLNRAAALLAEKTLVVDFVDNELAEFRLNICEGCQFFDHINRRCKVCKCYVDAKTKAKENFNPIKLRYEVTHCPKGFWKDQELAEYYKKIDGSIAE